MRHAIAFTGLTGSVLPIIGALLLTAFFSMGIPFGNFYLEFLGRYIVLETIVLGLMGGLGLVGSIRSIKKIQGNEPLIFVSALLGIYYTFDISRIMIIPTILLSLSSILIIIKAVYEFWER